MTTFRQFVVAEAKTDWHCHVKLIDGEVKKVDCKKGNPPPKGKPPLPFVPNSGRESKEGEKSNEAEVLKDGRLAIKDDPQYKKYFDMKKKRVPIGAVKNKMRADGFDPSFLDRDPDQPAPVKSKKKKDVVPPPVFKIYQTILKPITNNKDTLYAREQKIGMECCDGLSDRVDRNKLKVTKLPKGKTSNADKVQLQGFFPKLTQQRRNIILFTKQKDWPILMKNYLEKFEVGQHYKDDTEFLLFKTFETLKVMIEDFPLERSAEFKSMASPEKQNDKRNTFTVKVALELLKYDNYSKRIQVLLDIPSFKEGIVSITEKINKVKVAAKDIINNDALQRLLIILSKALSAIKDGEEAFDVFMKKTKWKKFKKLSHKEFLDQILTKNSKKNSEKYDMTVATQTNILEKYVDKNIYDKRIIKDFLRDVYINIENRVIAKGSNYKFSISDIIQYIGGEQHGINSDSSKNTIMLVEMAFDILRFEKNDQVNTMSGLRLESLEIAQQIDIDVGITKQLVMLTQKIKAIQKINNDIKSNELQTIIDNTNKKVKGLSVSKKDMDSSLVRTSKLFGEAGEIVNITRRSYSYKTILELIANFIEKWRLIVSKAKAITATKDNGSIKEASIKKEMLKTLKNAQSTNEMLLKAQAQQLRKKVGPEQPDTEQPDWEDENE